MAKLQHAVRLTGKVQRVTEFQVDQRRTTSRNKQVRTALMYEQVAKDVALELAGGDASRLEFHQDGTITVHNQAVRKRRRA